MADKLPNVAAPADSGLTDLAALYKVINGETVTDSGNTTTYGDKTVASSGGKVTNSGYNVTNSGNQVDTSLNTVVQSLQNSSADTTGTNVTTHSGSQNHTIQHSSISQDAMNSMLRNILESTQGLAAVSSGQRAGGAYGSTTNTLLTNDLMARAAAQVAQNDKTVDTTENIGGSTDTTNINSHTNTNTQAITATNQVGSTKTGASTQTVGGSTVTTDPSSVTTSGGAVTVGPSTRTTGGIDGEGIAKVAGIVGGIAGIGSILGGTSSSDVISNIIKGTTGKSNGTNINTGGVGIPNFPNAGVNNDPSNDPNKDDNPDVNGSVGDPIYDPNIDSDNGSVTDPYTPISTIDQGTQGGSNVDDDGKPLEDYADGGVVSGAAGSNYDAIASIHQMTLNALQGGSTTKKASAAGGKNTSAADERANISSVNGEQGYGDAAIYLNRDLPSNSGSSGSSGSNSSSDITSRLSLSIPDLSAKDLSTAASGLKFAGSLSGDKGMSGLGKDLGMVGSALNIATSDNPLQAAAPAALNMVTGGLYGKVSGLYNTITNPTTAGIIDTISSLNPVTALINGGAKMFGLPSLGSIVSSIFNSTPDASARSREDTSTVDSTKGFINPDQDTSVANLSGADMANISAAADRTTETTANQTDTGDMHMDQVASIDTGNTGGNQDIYAPDAPGGGCVHIDSYLPSGNQAGQIAVGDKMILADQFTLEPGSGEVTYSEEKTAPGYMIFTLSGVTLVCSNTAPIPTMRHGLQVPQNLLGKHVATLVLDQRAWDEVVSVESVGDIQVQHITVGDKCFWAGAENGKYILHHNIKGVESEGTSGGFDMSNVWGFADGGRVPSKQIPGADVVAGTSPTEISDDKQINATSGEIILPVDVSQNPEARDAILQIIDQFHTPAAAQRKQIARRV